MHPACIYIDDFIPKRQEDTMTVNHSLPHVLPEMLTPDFWADRLANPSALLLTPEKIHHFNQLIRQRLPGEMMDLAAFPREMDSAVLHTWLTKPRFPQKTYDSCGKPLSSAFLGELKNNINATNLPRRIAVAYGTTIRHAEMRLFPTDEPAFATPEDTRFDQWQATAVNPGEPLIILHQSLDGKWCYVQTEYYRGWIAARYLARFSSRSQWLSYLRHSPFLTVTGPGLTVTLPPDSSESVLRFEMGAKIRAFPVAGSSQSFLGFIPTGKSGAPLTFPLALSPDLAFGYLPYTETHLFQQAFKMLGQPYGWGGQDLHPDCSSFTRNLYRCFGFDLPRDSGVQARCSPNTVPLNHLPPEQKSKVLSALPAGTLLHLDGHIMVYLGMSGGRHYVIHALSGYRRGQHHTIYLMAVTVSDLSLRRLNGQTLLDALTSAVILR